MHTTRELLDQLKEHIETAEQHELEPGVATIDHADSTQVRLAAHRLGLFLEHLEHLKDGHVIEEIEDDLAALTRDALNTRARDAGIEDPEKLPNKPAVIEAIEAAERPASDVTDATDGNQSPEGDGSAAEDATGQQEPEAASTEPASDETAAADATEPGDQSQEAVAAGESVAEEPAAEDATGQ